MSSYLSVPENGHPSLNLRQSRSLPSSPVLERRQRNSHSGSGSPLGPGSPLLPRRATTPEPRIGLTAPRLTVSLLQARDPKCTPCSDSPPSSVKSCPTSPTSYRRSKKKTPSYMRSTFAADKRSVRNSYGCSSETSSEDENHEFEDRRSEFAPPTLLPPIWCSTGAKSPSLKKRTDLKVLPSIRVSPVEHLEAEFAKLETCRYLRTRNGNKSS